MYLNYDITPWLAFSFRLDNLFNRQYFTFGGYGEAEEVLGEIYPDISSVEFVGPAKPRAFAMSLNICFKVEPNSLGYAPFFRIDNNVDKFIIGEKYV